MIILSALSDLRFEITLTDTDVFSRVFSNYVNHVTVLPAALLPVSLHAYRLTLRILQLK